MGGTGVKIEDVIKVFREEIQPFWEKHEKDEIKAVMSWEELLDEIMSHSEDQKIFFAEDNNNFYFIYDDLEKERDFVIVSLSKKDLFEEFRFEFF